MLAFLGTGVANTVLTYALYVALLRLVMLSPGVAYTLAFLAGIALSAAFNIRLVFGAKPTMVAVSRYTGVYLCVWALGLGLVTLLTKVGTPAELAPLIALPATAGAAYLLSARVLRSAGE